MKKHRKQNRNHHTAAQVWGLSLLQVVWAHMIKFQRRTTRSVRGTGQLPHKKKKQVVGWDCLSCSWDCLGRNMIQVHRLSGEKKSVDKWQAKFNKDKWNWCTEWKIHLVSAEARNRGRQAKLDAKQTWGGVHHRIGGRLVDSLLYNDVDAVQVQMRMEKREKLRITEYTKQDRLKKIIVLKNWEPGKILGEITIDADPIGIHIRATVGDRKLSKTDSWYESVKPYL